MFQFIAGNSQGLRRNINKPEFQSSKVLPGLYVGNYRDSKDAAQLNKYHITHILAIHDGARRMHPDKHYLCVMASDSPDQNLTQYFSVCNDFIHAARLRDGNVLIHCLAGMSRSVTVAVAYIMTVSSLSWKDALKVVRAGRQVANPNLGFQKQLQEFEDTKLIEERRRLKERFPSLALVALDTAEISLSLDNYAELLLTQTICEGRCTMGRQCPSGMCRQMSLGGGATGTCVGANGGNRRNSGRRRSRSSQPGVGSGGGGELSRSPSVVSVNQCVVRPRSGPAGLHSYTGSAPPSRAGSRIDLSTLPSSGTLTAPTTPASSPPVSPIRRRSTMRHVTHHVPFKEVGGS